MKKPSNPKTGKKEHNHYRWALTAFVMAVALSGLLSLSSEAILENAGLLLALAMMLTLTACQINIPGVGTVRINDGSKNDHDADGSPAGNSDDTSLAQLREEAMDLPSYLFAAAYIGSSASTWTLRSCRRRSPRRRR